MAGGFDGMEVRTPVTRSEPHTAQASVMEVRYEESTHGVDNLYKYLKNKNILLFYVGFTKFPEISAICR